MSIYVWRSWYEKPRVQHLAAPHEEPDFANSLCGELLWSAEFHARKRRAWMNSGHRKSTATLIDYDALPMCKRCEKARSDA